MSFNRGFLCPDCGPIPAAKKKSIAKVQHDCCPDCGKIVNKWERPMNERAGRCGHCANGSFTSAMGKGKTKGHLLRCCKQCGEVVDLDDSLVVVRKGDKKHEYKPRKTS